MLKLYDVKCEYRNNPIGICKRSPRFSFKLKGENGTKLTAYRIQVMSEKGYCVWDTGKTEQEKYFAINYEGLPLEIMHRYTYIVTVWDNKGNYVASSENFFETGFFSLSDWKAKWITAKQAQGPMHIRAEFELKKDIKSVRLYAASTAGAFWNNSSRMNIVHLTLNGERVSDECFTPGQISDRKWRALYRVYDITEKINHDKNTLGAVILSMAFSAFLSVIYSDGSRENIILDDMIRTAGAGPYHLWDEGTRGQGGKCESYNAQKEYKGFDSANFDDITWNSPVFTDVVSCLEEQTVITKVIESLKPVSITKKGYTHYIVDFGQNINGHIKLTIYDSKSKRRITGGDRISVIYGEALYENGEINYCSTINYNNGENGPHTDSFISAGNHIDIFEPRFSNHSFRYADVINYPGELNAENVCAQVVHSEIFDDSGFICSDDDINKLYNISRWSQRCNLMSIPTDCPSRERLGWLGDALVVSESECINFDLIKLYENWCRNMGDDQEDSGNVQYISPYPAYSQGSTDIPWSSACVLIPWYVYQVYGDTHILKNSYSVMVKWIEYLNSLCDDKGLVNGGVLWNDHTAQQGMNPKWLGNIYYYACLDTVSKIAKTLDLKGDFDKYSEMAHRVRKELRNGFKGEGGFADLLQSDYAHALRFGIADEGERPYLANALNELIKSQNGQLTCGALGIFAAIPSLSDNGFNDTVFELCKDKRDGSFGGWITNHGATTACESLRFSDWFSQNHPFLMGSVTTWFYEKLCGIHRTSAGYQSFIIDPFMPNGIDWVQGQIETLYGVIGVRWERRKGNIIYSISVPCGTEATLITPDKKEIILGSGEHEIMH